MDNLLTPSAGDGSAVAGVGAAEAKDARNPFGRPRRIATCVDSPVVGSARTPRTAVRTARAKSAVSHRTSESQLPTP